MNIYEYEMKRLKHGIAAALPERVVSESLIDHAEWRREELLKGVVTVMLERIKSDGEWSSTLQVLITGQLEVELPENKDIMGARVESAEISLYSELRAFLRNTGGLPSVEVQDVEFSAHSKAPFGWFMLRAQYGPINEACMDWDFSDLLVPPNMYPPTVLVTPFDGVDIKVDMEPHETDKTHEKWLTGERTDEQPEATIKMELQNGNQG